MSVGQHNYCAFALHDLCILQSWVPPWHAAFLTAAFEVAAHSPLARAGHIFVAAPQAGAIVHQVSPKPPLGNLCIKEHLQDFEGIQNFEKQVIEYD